MHVISRRIPAVLCLLLCAGTGVAQAAAPAAQDHAAATACAADNGGLSLAPGFCASIFADQLGHVRHLAVSPQGVVYANSWSGRYFHNDKPTPGGFLLALRDSSGSGHADQIQRFGVSAADGAAGGTGIALYHGYVYAEEGDSILRYALSDGAAAPAGKPEVVLSGMPLGGDHPMHPFVIDSQGQLFVDMGSASNACQQQNRMEASAGQQPCDELRTRAGIWRYDANRTAQSFSAAQRWATGLRNAEGYAFDAAGRFFATQHGRDQLSQNWPALYRAEQGAELPAEELVLVERGGDYGWPECYFDEGRHQLVLAPEYGGDGSRAGECAQKKPPVAAFPAHWAPNDLLIGTAQLPPAYAGGAFIAFHGSWNRAPAPQGGYNVVFQPLKDGKAAGPWVVFADGFAGATKEPGRAAFRPTGLAQGPDGALYVADDQHGRIWRIVYQGDPAKARVQGAPPPGAAANHSAEVPPPEGIHPDAGLPLPPGASAEQVERGGRIFRGEAGGTCLGCHGSDAKGSPVGPDLTSGHWVWGDGSVAAIANTIRSGVPAPKNFSGAMPPKGGAQLSDAQVQALAAYVWAVGHRGQ